MRLPTALRAGVSALLILGSAPAWSQTTGSPGSFPAWPQTTGSAGSFPLHEENGAATLIERTGLGSQAARMVGEFTKADIREMCERIGWKFYSPSFPFHGTLQDRQTITICRAREEARPREERLYEVRANCPEGLLWNDMGYTFRRAGSDWQTLSGRPVSSEFSSGYTRVLSRQFEMLCAGAPAVAQAPSGGSQRVEPSVMAQAPSAGFPQTAQSAAARSVVAQASAGGDQRVAQRAFDPVATGSVVSGRPSAPAAGGTAQPDIAGGVGGIGGRSLIAEARARSRGW